MAAKSGPPTAPLPGAAGNLPNPPPLPGSQPIAPHPAPAFWSDRSRILRAVFDLFDQKPEEAEALWSWLRIKLGR